MLRFTLGGLLFLGDAAVSVYVAPFESSGGMIVAAAVATVVGVLPEAYRWADRLFSGDQPEA